MWIARHEPTRDDMVMARYFQDRERPLVVVANKCDKLRSLERGSGCGAHPDGFGSDAGDTAASVLLYPGRGPAGAAGADRKLHFDVVIRRPVW